MPDGRVIDVRLARTEEFSRARLVSVRRLLDAAFDDGFDDDDWEHTIGGFHVYVEDEGDVVAHAAVVARTLRAGGLPLHAGYVEGVATAAAHRGRGLGSAVMRRAAAVIHGGFDIGALATEALGFYARLGWESWRGPTFTEGASGRMRTADDDGGIMILRTAKTLDLDVTLPLTCEWRSGDVW